MAGLDDSVYLYGEITTADGKTVAVDVMVRNAIVAAAHIRGDFTLKPDTAYDAVNLALGTAPFFARTRDIANDIRDAMGADAILSGVTVDDIAAAMRKALDQNQAA